MRKLGRRPFLVGSLLAGACGGNRAVAPPPHAEVKLEKLDAAPPSAPSAPIPDAETGPCVPEMGVALRALTGFSSAKPTLPTLYSFTTAEQAAGLRRGDPVFTRSTNKAGHRGHLFDVLAAHTKHDPRDPIPKLLSSKRFAVGRFGWPFLAGTRISPERYGNEILSFRFKPESIFVSFRASFRDRRYAFFDIGGGEVASAVALAAPERIAAFFFLNDTNVSYGTGYDMHCPTAGAEPLIYRELYLGNSAMIAECSLGTQAIVDRLEAEIADLRSLAKELDCTHERVGSGCASVLRGWSNIGPSRPARFLASTAFTSWFGAAGASSGELERLATDLEGLRFSPNPYVVKT